MPAGEEMTKQQVARERGYTEWERNKPAIMALLDPSSNQAPTTACCGGNRIPVLSRRNCFGFGIMYDSQHSP